MIFMIFCVKDRATDTFGSPMFLVTANQAIRSFQDEVNREAADNQIYQHPDDFDLYVLGKFHSDVGKFEVHDPVLVIRAKDCSNRLRSN